MGDGRRNPRRASRIALSAATIILAALPSTAGAATRVGDTFPTAGYCDSFFTNLQSGSPVGQYTAPFPGVLTSWSYQADASPPQVRFKVARPAGGSNFAIVGQSDLITPAPGALHTAEIRLPVSAGDVIGLYTTNGECGRSGPSYTMHYQPGDIGPGLSSYTGPSPSQLNISATLEPDCDGDGFGDESQDQDVRACDVAPPDTAITGGPDEKTKKKSATFEFFGSDARVVASFECSLDGGAFAACTSPHTVKVKKGKHTFSVRAMDAAGNVDASPATDDWRVKKKRKKK